MKEQTTRILSILTTGLFFCAAALADAPATAVWTGGGNRNVVTDPANWQCFDAGGNVIAGAIPDASVTAVSVTGETKFNFPAGQQVIWNSLSMSGTVTLAADCDWRGMGSLFGGFVAANTTLNLKGHKLYVGVPNGNTNRRINVTDDSPDGSGGEFHIDVPEGNQFNNNGGWNSDNVIWFSGSVEVVKDGKGTYVPYYANGNTGFRYYQQTGGTRIHEGLVFLGNDAEGTKNETYYAQNNRPVFGALGAPITIDAEGTLDYKGIYDIARYRVYMNGGTFKNTRAPARPDYGSNGTIVFGADSFIDVARTAHISGPFVLNGHTLTATIAANQIWYCRAGSASNGTVKVEGDGVFMPYYEAITATDNATYDIACAINMAQPMSVSNYVARYAGSANTGTAAFKVFGTFTPVADGFYPVTMQNGSTIDLSGKTGAWSSTGTTGAIKFDTGTLVTFVTLDVGARQLVNGEKVVTWTQMPESVVFRITGTAITPTESARIEADGVYYDVPDAGVVAVAHWTGEGAHNDFNDPANWTCTNMLGELAPGAIPGERSNVYFGILNFDVADAAAVAKFSTYQNVMLEPPMTLTADCDWRGLSANDAMFSGVTINLAGHSLRLTCPNGTSQYAFTVTDDEETGGSFVADVPDGALFDNTLISIGGTAAFVKAGAGMFIPHRYDQPYTGGTTVAAGTLRFFNDAVANSSTYSPNRGYAKPIGEHRVNVYVEAGAFYDINGVYDINCYPVVLRGGTITNSKAQTQYTWGSIGNVTLEADSTIDASNSTVVFSGGNAVFNLNGHTLTAQFPETGGNHLYMYGVVISNGTFAVEGNGYLDFHTAATEAKTATLDCDSFTIFNQSIAVSNYVARYAGTVVSGGGSGAIQVYGSFKPISDRFYRTVLHDHATIDLSALSAAMNVVSPLGSLSYDAATSNVTISVGARTLQADEQLIVWDAAPAGITFTLEGDNVDGSKICVIENGVFYNVAEDSRLVTKASWTGQAGDGDISNSANWTCWNAYEREVANGVPGASAKVYISGAFNASIPADHAMPWQSVTFGSVTLTDDVDIRGLGNFFENVDATSIIDLHSHKLFVNAPNGNPSAAFTVTDSTSNADQPGELHINVPSGATFTNDRTTLSGNVKLVKEGDGVLIPQVFKVAYSGGNVVAGGTLKLYNDTTADSSVYAFGQTSNPNPLGVYGVPVVVEEGATFDINGNYDTSKQYFTLNGGTIANSKAQSKTGWGSFGNVSLTADSSLNVGNNLVSVAPYSLGGHTLECSIASGKVLYLKADISGGTLKTTGEGTLQIIGAAGSATMDLDVSTPLNVGGAVTARNYIARYEGTANAGTGVMTVSGVFTPVTDNFYGCTLQNGATLDLTEKTEMWSTKGAFESGLNTVTFAENAVVKVALSSERKYTFDENGVAQVVAWEEEPPASTQFKAVGLKMGRELLRRDGGLYVMRSGLMILFR